MNPSTPPPPKAGFTMSLGAVKPKTPLDNRTQPTKKQRRMGDDDDDDREEERKVEMVLGFEDNVIQGLTPKEKPKTLVIPSLPNRDWRDISRKKQAIYMPTHERDEAGAAAPEILGSTVTTYGLQLTEKLEQTQSAEAAAAAASEADDDTAAKMEDLSTKAEDEMDADPDKALEKKALEAIVAEATGEGNLADEGPQLVIPSVPLDSAEACRQDVANRPDEATMEDYENVPVEIFGAALLRGMGWKDGQAVGRNKNAPPVPVEFIQRQSLLGLGAKPEPPGASDARGRNARSKAFQMMEQKLVVRRRDLDVDRRSSDCGSDREGSSSIREGKDSGDDRRSKRRSRSRSRSSERPERPSRLRRERSRSRSRDRLRRERSRSRSREDRGKSHKNERDGRDDGDRSAKESRGQRKDRSRSREREKDRDREKRRRDGDKRSSRR